MQYRSRDEIIREILNYVAEKPRKKTHVMMRGAGLSYAQLRYYERFLTENGLISITAEGDWSITRKGKDLLAISGKYAEILTKSK